MRRPKEAESTRRNFDGGAEMDFLKRNWKCCVLLLLAVLFLSLGIWRGEAGVVYQKASNICMECIGLG